ncbi:MAG TPA: M28 family peptidase [Ferruginibacter sp.]|nr:M28 family peptidase [Ferruginibacter sp.]HPH92916.1 M28 family peptidase [Ferruginibacter sp.]
MKYLSILFLFLCHNSIAQKFKKADKIIISSLQSHIAFLADDKLEGRRTGSEGEKKAADYIMAAFTKTGLTPKGDNETFLQQFEVNDGRAVSASSHCIINGHDLQLNKDFFPLTCCPSQSLEATCALAMQEGGSPWFYDIKDLLDENKNNPHFDLEDAIKTKALQVKQKGCTGLFIYNSSTIKDELQFEGKRKTDPAAIPVVYISNAAREKYLKDETETLDIKLKIALEDKKRYGHNVAGFINNGAASTVVIGAHYDHLGWGEDHNSLHAGDPAIHNGADDNASGTAALIELSKMLKASKLKNSNYLFIAFSGEELGLFGSKFFVEHPTVDLSTVNYMINMDMVGRLNDSTHALTVGGYGTSPSWGQTLTAKDKFITVKFDSSGSGPSDHTSFYRKDIPVLFFFTGLHTDYHKPSDDADRINYTGELMVLKYIYKAIELNNGKGKPVFTKTREMQTGTSTRFKVTLGIMPDYSFTGDGVRADGVSAGKIAEKAGMKAGDIIVQIGDHSFADMQGYMEALSKFKKGDAAKVKVKRGAEELIFDVVF